MFLDAEVGKQVASTNVSFLKVMGSIRGFPARTTASVEAHREETLAAEVHAEAHVEAAEVSASPVSASTAQASTAQASTAQASTALALMETRCRFCPETFLAFILFSCNIVQNLVKNCGAAVG
jgi:hypothetical protein